MKPFDYRDIDPSAIPHPTDNGWMPEELRVPIPEYDPSAEERYREWKREKDNHNDDEPPIGGRVFTIQM